MRRSSFPAPAIGILLALSTACSDPAQPEPPNVGGPPIAASPPAEPATGASPVTADQTPAAAFPDVSQFGEIYEEHPSQHVFSPVHGGVLESRFVIYHGGTFGLQYLSPDPRWGFFEYTGRYTLTGSTINFWFAGWNDRWNGPDATGTLDSSSLQVKYLNDYMIHSDFRGALYIHSSLRSAVSR